MVGLDIESLYTNIPHNDGLEIIKNLLNTHPQPCRIPTDFVIDLLRFALNNYFLYKDTFSLQIKGVSMGACFAPNFAILYVRSWETRKILTPTNPVLNKLVFGEGILMIYSCYGKEQTTTYWPF